MSEESRADVSHDETPRSESEPEREHELDSRQRRDARRREAPSAAVVYEAIRPEAESELIPAAAGAGLVGAGCRPVDGVFVRGPGAAVRLHAGCSWHPIIASFGYSMGFLFVILGRQQLFTENTLTPVLEVLRVRRMATVIRTFKLWVVVLVANIVGTAIFAAVLAMAMCSAPDINGAMTHIAARNTKPRSDHHDPRGVRRLAGRAHALAAAVRRDRARGRDHTGDLPHRSGPFPAHHRRLGGGTLRRISWRASLLDYLLHFFLPTLIGNIVGGIMMVAVINYAQVAYSDSSRES